MLYRIGMALMRFVAFTLLVATVMLYLLEGETVRMYFCAVVTLFVLVMAALMWGEHRSRSKNVPASPVSILDHEDGAVTALALVRRLPERPVMWYKGEIFDFVHNDPTQPDPVRVISPAT